MSLKNIVYLSVEQFKEIKEKGFVVVDGQTIPYSRDDDYRIPDTTAQQIAALEAELKTQNTKITALQSSVSNLVLEEVFAVGSRYIQFPDEPTPAERLGGTWELDDKAMDKFLVGAGNLYALGATGGSADAVVVEHKHNGIYASGNPDWEFSSNTSIGGTHEITHAIVPDVSVNETGATTSGGLATGKAGEDGMGKNLPPYLAVKIWKRKS